MAKISKFVLTVHGKRRHYCPGRTEQFRPAKQAECCGSGPGYTNIVGHVLPIVKMSK
jgi:hypothetical protein